MHKNKVITTKVIHLKETHLQQLRKAPKSAN